MAGRHRLKPERRRILQRLALAAVTVSLFLSLTTVSAQTVNKEPEPIAAPVLVPDEMPIPAATVTRINPTPVPEPTIAPVVVETPEPEPEPEPVVKSLSDYKTSGFNGVKPHVAQAGYLISDLFGVPTSSIGGVGARANASDHPKGLALDFMCNRVTGDLIADYMLDNFDELNLSYIIWRQRINFGSGWEPMEDRGGITANHMDHVHASFNP